MTATPDGAIQRRRQCNPDKKGTRECDDRKRNRVVVHTGYTEQLPDSLDDRCNTTSLVLVPLLTRRLGLPILSVCAGLRRRLLLAMLRLRLSWGLSDWLFGLGLAAD